MLVSFKLFEKQLKLFKDDIPDYDNIKTKFIDKFKTDKTV